MLNTVFYKDLKVRINDRQVYTGTLMGMDFSEKKKSRRCYVKLDDPSIEIKVYAEDLDYHYNCRYGPVGDTFNDRGSTVSVAPMVGSFKQDADDLTPPRFDAGGKVAIRVGDYAQFHGQTSRSRWVFIMSPARLEESEAGRRQSLVRNSVIDRGLLKDLDQQSLLGGVSEHSDCSGDEIV